MFKTHNSFRVAFGSPEAIVPIVKAQGYPKAPIADISSTFGFVKWEEACKANDIKPVFGVSLFVTDNIAAKKPRTDLWTFYAIDDIKAVNDLVKIATEQFRYNPLLTYEQALNAKGVIKITGHRSLFEFMKPAEDLYVSISPATSKGYIKQFDPELYNFVQWQENRYPLPEDELTWEVAAGRNSSLQTYPQHILTGPEWHKYVSKLELSPERLEAATGALQSILERCNASLKQADLLRPKVDKTLRQMCVEGAPLIGVDLSDPVYAERLETELKVIEEKKFEDYFFVVADVIQWAKANQMVGPGRGSSAGSLVCYLLGITQVDPIKYNLLFFRFLDPGRSDWPDIDFDLSDRDAAIDYLVNKYGTDHVAKLGTMGGWQTKNTTNEVSKALGINKYEVQAVIDLLPKYAANDKRNETALAKSFEVMDAGKAFIEKYPEFSVATRMIGMPSNAATHASGVILTNEPIRNYVAVDSRTNTTMCDLHEAEKLGMIKVDVLGLKTLTILDQTLKIAGLPRNHFEKIELEDQKVFDVLNDGKFLGIFQFDGDALRKLTRTLKVDCFSDLSILSALGRPGASVGADAWVRRKMGEEDVSYPHPALEPYLKDTLGVLVYQETVMQIAHYVADMDWGKVSKLRKAIGKSMGAEAMAEYGEPFITGLVNKGVEQSVAQSFWNDILAFGSYSFNLSHTIAYGLISYWTAYCKAYYPVEFAAATLTLEGDHEKMLELLRELDREGVSYKAIDPENSTDKWRVVNGNLIGPLTLIDGIGPKMVQQILSARARNEPLPDRAQKLLSDPKTKIDSLYPIKSAIDKIDLLAQNIQSKPQTVFDITPDGYWQDNVVFIGVVRSCSVKSENDPKRIEDRISRGQQGYINGEDRYVDLRLADDTGEIFCKIGRKEFAELSPKVVDVVEDDKTIVCVSGTVTPEIKMILVKRLKVIGSL